MATDDKALVASSEFDPTTFKQGVDAMIASLTAFIKKEDELRQRIAQLNQDMAANRTALKATEDQLKALDKTSTTYKTDLEALNRVHAQLRTNQQNTQASLKATQTELTATTKSVQGYQSAVTTAAAAATKVFNDSKGRGLFDTATIQRQVQEVLNAGSSLRNVFQGKIDTSELEALEARLGEVGDEFGQLAEIIDFVRQKLDTLDPNSEEFAELSKVVATGEQVLAAYGKTQEEVAKKSQSLRGRLTELRTQMVALEDQGKENTEEFRRLALEAGRLQDSIGDAQERIRVLASDTKNIDFGLGVARLATAGYGIFAGVMELAGLRTEDAIQTIARLNAIMAVLNGLQEVQNLLKSQSVVAIVGEELALKASTVAQRIYAVAVGTSTGAMRAFRVALLGTGIGAFIVLLGLAAEAMGVFEVATDAATKSAEGLTRAIDEGVGLMEARLQAVKTGAAVDEERARRQITNEQQLNARLTQIRAQALEEEARQVRQRIAVIRGTQEDYLNKGGFDQEFIQRSNQLATSLGERLRDLEAQLVIEREKALTKQLEEQRKAYDAYVRRLLELQRQLRDAQLANQPQDEQAILQALTNTFNDALDDLEEEVRKGTLTKGRADVLGQLLEQLTAAQTEGQLREFRQRALEAQRAIDEQLTDLQNRSALERAELLRDQLEREGAVIRQQLENEREQLLRERDALLRDIQQTQLEGLISPEAAAESADQVLLVFEQLLADLATRASRQLEALTVLAFQNLREEVRRQFALLNVSLSEEVTQEIVVLAQRFAAGKISYERYQRELTDITQRETARRVQLQLEEAETQLRATQQRLREAERLFALQVLAEDGGDRGPLDQLRAEEADLRKQISELKRQLATANAEGLEQDRAQLAARIQVIAQYAQAIGSIVTQVVRFWEQVNQAEQRALERSVALQEQRVAAATRVAERGNAEYLRLEEARLQELQLKQENAARRQLAINAVLQTSQALTAFVSALAQGIATGGPLGGLAIATAVLGALAAGYAIVQSLTQQTPQRLFKGTKRVKREHGEPDGVDTVPAMLTAGEAVVPKDKNEAYAPTMDAVFDGTIPPEVLNRFVLNYRTPELDYDRLGAAAEVTVQADARLLAATQEQNRLLAEQNQELMDVKKVMAESGVDIRIDKDGLAVSVVKAIARLHVSKKA